MKISFRSLRFPAAALLLLLCVFHIEAIIAGIRAALSVCAVSIVPSLFLFLVLSDMIVSILLSESRTAFSKYTVFFLGALCGFPTGAAICERLCKEQALDARSAARLLPLCNCVSPAFVIGAIGASMLGDIRIGILLYVSQFFATLVFLLPLRVHFSATDRQPETRSFAEIFFAATEKSVGSILRICALICLFSALLSILRVYCSETVYGILAVLLEIGCGASAAASMFNTSPMSSLVLCAFACAWSGICVHFQIFSAARSIKVNAFRFVICKSALGILSAVIALIGYKLFFCS